MCLSDFRRCYSWRACRVYPPKQHNAPDFYQYLSYRHDVVWPGVLTHRVPSHRRFDILPSKRKLEMLHSRHRRLNRETRRSWMINQGDVGDALILQIYEFFSRYWSKFTGLYSVLVYLFRSFKYLARWNFYCIALPVEGSMFARLNSVTFPSASNIVFLMRTRHAYA